MFAFNRIQLRIAAAAATVAMASACADTPTSTSARLRPATPLLDVSSGAVTGIAYATRSPAQRLDIHIPTTGTKPYPVVLWLHPGGWSTGDKTLSPTSAQLQLLNQGIAVVSANYRLSGEARFPAQIQDAKAAVRWIRANAATYKLDPNRIGAWGLSAGAHLVALLGTSHGVASLTDLSLGNAAMSDYVKAVAAWATPVSFLNLDSQLSVNRCPVFNGVGHAAASSPESQLLGAPILTIPSKVSAANPRTHVTAGDAKFLIQHGTLDCTIPYQQGQGLHNRLTSVLGAAQSTLELFPTGKHGGPEFTSSTNMAKILQFFKSKL